MGQKKYNSAATVRKSSVDGRMTYVVIGPRDVVPRGYYPLEDILTGEPYNLEKEIYRGIRHASYWELRKRVQKRNIKRLSYFWNNHASELPPEINKFSRIKGFEGMSRFVKMFMATKKSQNRYVARWTKFVSFGISKKIYDKFVETGTVPKKLNYTRAFDRTVSEFTTITISEETWETVHVRRTPVVELWKTWCKANGLKQTDAIIDAMKLQMKMKPGTAEVPSLEEFVRGKTVDDYVYKAPDELVDGENTIKTSFKMDRSILEESMAMLGRYNKYADLTGHRRLNRQEYINKALVILNRSVNKQILDFTKEYIELSKDEDYYKKYLGDSREE